MSSLSLYLSVLCRSSLFPGKFLLRREKLGLAENLVSFPFRVSAGHRGRSSIPAHISETQRAGRTARSRVFPLNKLREIPAARCASELEHRRAGRTPDPLRAAAHPTHCRLRTPTLRSELGSEFHAAGAAGARSSSTTRLVGSDCVPSRLNGGTAMTDIAV